MSKRTLEIIKQEFETLTSKKSEDIVSLEGKKKSCEAEIVEINQSLEAARLENNVDKYDQGKRALWTANNSLEMLSANLEDLRSKPLVTREEYDQYEKEIEEFAKDKELEMLEELEKLCSKLDKVSVKYQEHYEQVNELLLKLQNDIGNNWEDFKYAYRDGKRYGIISNRYLGLDYNPKSSITWMVDRLKEDIQGALKWY